MYSLRISYASRVRRGELEAPGFIHRFRQHNGFCVGAPALPKSPRQRAIFQLMRQG